jgi:hypothetical protein
MEGEVMEISLEEFILPLKMRFSNPDFPALTI